jgi:hypothetical protein
MKKLLALLAVLGLVSTASVSSAAVTYGYQKNPTTTSVEDTAFADVAGYDHYVFYIKVDDASSVVRAFDISLNTGAVAGLRQQVKKPIGGTAYALTMFEWNENDGTDYGRTTVALTQDQIDRGCCKGSLVQVATRTTSGYEDTSYIKYAYGISGESGALWQGGWTAAGNNDLVAGQAGVWDVMNVYLKQGITATVYFAAAAGDAGTGKFFEQTFTIPEPATIGLLAMGIVGLLRRKLA